jgi:phytanoyl-CoA hydroxylase
MQTNPLCPDRLSETQLAQFREDGYLAFEQVLSQEEVQAAGRALRGLTERTLADADGTEWHYPEKGGQQGGAWAKKKDSRLFLQLESGWDPRGQTVDEVDLKLRKYMWFVDEDPVFADLIGAKSKLRGVVESILGAAPLLFQEMALVKPPFIGSEKPWHQDNAYFSVAPLEAVLGVWIALDPAGVENGCMHVIPGGHRLGSLKHHHSTDCEILPGRLEVERARAVPVGAGGGLFFYGLLPHETPPNRSPLRRRALQFHYRGRDSKIVDAETYNRIFAERDGTPASCAAA